MEISIPLTKEFASSMLQIYKPWKEKFVVCEDNCEDFEAFVHSDQCPEHLTMSYVRSMRRYTNPENRRDQIGKKSLSDAGMDSETEDFLTLTGMHRPENSTDGSPHFDYGIQYDWSVERNNKVSPYKYVLSAFTISHIFALVTRRTYVVTKHHRFGGSQE